MNLYTYILIYYNIVSIINKYMINIFVYIYTFNNYYILN